MITVPYFFYEIQTRITITSINLATLTIKEKKLLVIPYSLFFPKTDLNTKKYHCY